MELTQSGLIAYFCEDLILHDCINYFSSFCSIFALYKMGWQSPFENNKTKKHKEKTHKKTNPQTTISPPPKNKNKKFSKRRIIEP